MIDILIALLIIPFIAAMVWNGLHGKGYKVVFQPPPSNTAKGKLVRTLMLVYIAAGICVLFASQFASATSEGYRGASRIIDVVVVLLVILGLNLAWRLWRYK